MFKRILILLAVVFAVVPALAQNAPDPINAALQDLSTRLNRTVTLAQVVEWNYQQSIYPSPALGCPQPGVSYADVLTSGFQFIITYDGTVYDYRVSDDKSIVVLCGTAPAPASVPPCPPPNDTAFLAPRLSKGVQARVIAGGLPNVIRQQPGSSSQLLGQIPPNDTLIVIDGPRCTLLDKIIWWQINYNNLIGWTGEGQEGTYWLEPADIALTATPAASIIPPQELSEANANAVSQLYMADLSTPFVLDDTRLIVGREDGSVSVLDYRSNTVMSTVSAHSGAVTSVVSGVDATQLAYYIASGGADGIIKIWELDPRTQSLQLLTQISAHTGAVTSLAFENRGQILASGGEDTSVRLWRVADGALLMVLNGHATAVTELTFSRTAILSRDSTGKLLIWGIPSDASVG